MLGKRMWPLVFAMTAVVFAQAPSTARFKTLLDNPQTGAYSLELPEHARATVYQGTHDVIWIALKQSSIEFASHDSSETVLMNAGDVRFFSAFQLAAIANARGPAAKGVLVEIKQRGQTTQGCECSGTVERSICGCPGGAHLPALWAFGMGGITLGGTTLAAGESFLGSSLRENMLLVAVTDIDLQDEAATGASSQRVRLASGEVRWLPAGAHQFRNLGGATARFVSIEF